MNRFPSSERNQKIMQTVIDFFTRENIVDFPLDPFAIIKANKWGLISYSELAQENNLSIEEVIAACQSVDGYIIRDNHNFTIAYNDTIVTSGRIRFTLMHEIGHICLNHLIDFDETIMNRSRLTLKKYRILENEAHAFARNTLAPAKVVTDLKAMNQNTISIGDLMYHFKLSQAAAKTRIQFLISDTMHHALYASMHQNYFKEYAYNMFHSKYCNKCDYFFIHESATFCPICGHKKLSSKGRIKMIYKGYDLNENGIPHICPWCENEEKTDGEYCKICGLHLVNICTNIQYDRDGDFVSQCRTITKGIRFDGNSRHCYECGTETTYFNNELLVPWRVELDSKKREES